MILITYIIIKLLVKSILLDSKFAPKISNTTIKRNIKIITSIMYRNTIEVITESCNKLRDVIVDPGADGIPKRLNKKQKLYGELKDIEGPIDPFYVKACRDYYKNRNNNENDLHALDENKLIERINRKLTDFNP